MAKKAILIANIDTADFNNNGITKKLIGQAKGLSSCGYDVDILSNWKNEVRLNGSMILQNSLPKLISKLNWYKPLYPVFSANYDLLWLRHHVVTPDLIRFLDYVKSQSYDTKIIIDLPTYPYNQEWHGVKGLLALLIDKTYAKKLHRYVDLITHSGPETELFGIRTVKLSNGIDISEVPLNTSTNPELTNIVAIGKWQYWHGLDRVIKGLSPDDHIELHVVGEGPYLSKLKAINNRMNLGTVIFHGALSGDRLNDLFNSCDLGIGTLGIHRKGVPINSSLKHREYCARGIPFIYSGSDPDFDTCHFIKRYEEDESVIHLDELRTFYNKIETIKDPQIIRDHGKNHLSWSRKIRPVIERVMNS